MSLEICKSRLDRGMPGGVVITPYWIKVFFCRSARMTPKPMVATPGSMPNTIMPTSPQVSAHKKSVYCITLLREWEAEKLAL